MPIVMPSPSSPRRGLAAASASVLLSVALAGCQSSPPNHYEDFGSSSRYSRSFEADEQRSCEAARRALLSQGYVIVSSTAELVNGRKNFQPENEVHVEIDLRVVCAPESPGSNRTAVFVTALQDRYALKKSNNSASVGVGALGSLSLPFVSGNDSMVKVASETIATDRFYDRFFELLERYLEGREEPADPVE